MTADERAKDRAGNVQSEIHPDYPFLVKLDIQYFILEGSVKVRYEWQHGDVIKTNTKKHIEMLYTQIHQSTQDYNQVYAWFWLRVINGKSN